MVHHKQNPRWRAGASRNQLAGWLRDPLNPLTAQTQFLIAAHHVRPELAAIIAALAFGGGGNHG